MAKAAECIDLAFVSEEPARSELLRLALEFSQQAEFSAVIAQREVVRGPRPGAKAICVLADPESEGEAAAPVFTAPLPAEPAPPAQGDPAPRKPLTISVQLCEPLLAFA